MGVVSYFPSLYEQPDFKTYTFYKEENSQILPVTGAYTSVSISDNYSKSMVIGNVPEHVMITASNLNNPITFPETIKSLYNTFNYCSSFYSDIYIKSNQITNVTGFVKSVKGANIYIRPELETLFRTSNANSIKGASITWTNDYDNSCFYNTRYNLKVFYNYEG